MFSCTLLSSSLVVLLFAFPALTAPSTPNDPFRAIALHVSKGPEPEICCLRPLEPATEEVLLSFEDWKAKRLEAVDHAAGTALNRGQKPAGGGVMAGEASPQPPGGDAAITGQSQTTGQNNAQQDAPDGSQDAYLSPHFRIPLTDRFNYASMDCSARVHTTHKSAKSPSSILSSKKDKYMLSPCTEEKQFVVVELCEDIHIDTVQLANFEFFSGVFKDFSVSVAKTYTTDEDGWTHAGTYRAQNIRGVQSFHPPPTLRDFYRFIRIDFHSHYGNEYYCPVSLLRVYGLTHLEHWKWDLWEAESRARRPAEEASLPTETIAASLQLNQSLSDGFVSSTDLGEAHSATTVILIQAPVSESTAILPLDSSRDDSDTPSGDSNSDDKSSTRSLIDVAVDDEIDLPEELGFPPARTKAPARCSANPHLSELLDDAPYIPNTAPFSVSFSYHGSSSAPLSQSPSESLSSDKVEGLPNSAISPSAQLSAPNTSSMSPSVATLSTSYLSFSSHAPPPQSFPPIGTGGESIYRTIMNRLSALEINTTLYARYVEEQTAGVREVLRRLSEDVGRLEGIGKAQSQMYQRSIADFDRQRRRLELEHRELLAKVNHLTDEVILEKRLGIAQLCLLLAVLVFITLTRGSRSRGEVAYRVPGLERRMTVQDWGRRTLSFSGDWVNRFRSRSPSATPLASSQLTERRTDGAPDSIKLLIQTQPTDNISRSRPPRSSSSKKLASRPHTPSSLRMPSPRHRARPMLHAAAHSTPLSSLSYRPQIQRSASGGYAHSSIGIGPVPRSAKRWARSAHLHEIKGATTGSSSSNRPLAGEDSQLYPNGVDDTPNTQIYLPATDVSKGASSHATAERSRHVRRFVRPVLTPLRLSHANDLPPSVTYDGPASASGASEGWVDTDSEM